MMERIAELNKKFSKTPIEEVLKYFSAEYRGKIALSTSLGAEDQVLTHMISKIDPKIKVFTLDTGRMFPEIYELKQK